jgi:hypothetical protein
VVVVLVVVAVVLLRHRDRTWAWVGEDAAYDCVRTHDIIVNTNTWTPLL